jgi:hypothetical protein
MLDNFRDYLLAEQRVKANHVPYYLKWVGDFYSFLDVPASARITNDQRARFLSHMAKSYEDWQVKQADTALRLYDYFLSRQLKTPVPKSDSEGSDWASARERIKTALRLRHLSYATEKNYLLWVRSYTR